MTHVKLVTLDPGHFHAALIQKEMYPDVSKQVAVYAPLGPDLIDHLSRIARFNLRPENPTAWELEVQACPDFLERMIRERPGNVVVISGRNKGKIDRILASVQAGLHVLADKPWVIESRDRPKLDSALDTAKAKGVIAYDIMTERFEITSILQRELVNDPDVFGAPVAGTEDEPGVFMESVHHLLKVVAGAVNTRPVWFFDIHQQGEGLTDVGTHLVDLVPWTLFPEQPIDYRKEIRGITGRRWPTVLSKSDLTRVTGQPCASETFEYYCNNCVSYTLRGIHVKLNVLWNFEAPSGTGDTHLAVYRGTESSIEVRQGDEQNYRPELYIVPSRPSVKSAVKKKIAGLQGGFPGVELEDLGDRMWISIPDSYRVGHEAHFAQVTRRFFEYLKDPEALPAWEKANMLAKYYVTTAGVAACRVIQPVVGTSP